LLFDLPWDRAGRVPQSFALETKMLTAVTAGLSAAFPSDCRPGRAESLNP
jgi:hypothetical protein